MRDRVYGKLCGFMDEDTLLIAENLRLAAQKASLSQASLAHKASVSPSRMSRIFRGEVGMRTDEFARVSRVFGLRADWFLEEHLPEVARVI